MNELIQDRQSMTRNKILNPESKSMQKKCDEMHAASRIILRYEEVEQTNDQIDFGLKFHDFLDKGSFFFKLLRNRSLGDFCTIYTSDKKKKH